MTNWYRMCRTAADWGSFWDDPQEEAAWQEELKKRVEEKKRRGSAVKEEIVFLETRPLTLYRGFDGLEKMKNKNGTYTMSPEGGDQNLIWFSHALFGRRFMEYADRGDYLLKYPIQVDVYKKRTWYEDGSYEDDYVESDDTKNSQMSAGNKLPDGFIFSYKMQKFIGSTKPLTFTEDMVIKRYEGDEFNELVEEF